MKKKTTANKFNRGDIVCAKVRPTVPLSIRLYARRMYFCIIQSDPSATEMVYIESELKPYVSGL